MWPWEHVAVGYLLLSVPHRVLTGRSPGDGAALALVAGTQFPDLVDKPLAWTLGVLPSGTSLAHSAFVAVPVVVVVLLVGRRVGRAWTATAFGIGYWSHLLGDVLYPVVLGGGPGYGAVLWPLVGTTRSSPPAGSVARFLSLFADLLALLATPAGTYYLLAEAALLGTALAVWVADGFPGTGVVRERLRRPDRPDGG